MSAVAVLDGIDDRDVPKMEWLQAAFRSDMDKIESLMRSGQVHIDSSDDDDVTALHIAAATGNNHLVRKLLDYGANIDACNQLGMTAFHHAAREGKLLVIDTLLQRGADYQKLTYLGVNALTLASAGGHVDVVKKLLSLRDNNWRSVTQWQRSLAPTPLIAATYFKSPQVYNYLIRAGASIDECLDNLKGLSALSAAIICTQSVYMVSSLLDLGASQTKRALHRMNAVELAKSAKRNDIVNVLNEKRAPRNDLEPRGDEARRIIADDRWVEHLAVDQPNQDGTTLLMFAIMVRSVNAVRGLLKRGIDVHAADKSNITATHVASLLRLDDVLPRLWKREHNADLNNFKMTSYDLLLLSADVVDLHTGMRAYFHPHRPTELATDANKTFNLSSSSASLYRNLQQPREWLNKMLMTTSGERAAEQIEPKRWLDALTHYQPSRERNAYKFALIDEILRGTKTIKPPDNNHYDQIIDATRTYMEESGSFVCNCFCDYYGEKDEAQSQATSSVALLSTKHYDVAQFYAHTSGYPATRKFPRNSLVLLHRRESSDNLAGSMERRKQRTISMVESHSQNQMRTTPRMLKKSRDSMMLSDEAAQRVSRASRPVPTVVVSPARRPISDDMIWSQFIRRNKRDLMRKLKEEEIDRYSFMQLTEANLHEMGIMRKEDWIVIKDIQRAVQSGSV